MLLTTVLIADFEKAGRATCQRLLQLEKKIKVVGEARCGLEAMTAAAKLKPRVLLLDPSGVEGEGVYLVDRKSTRLNSSHLVISYAVFCLKKKKPNTTTDIT